MPAVSPADRSGTGAGRRRARKFWLVAELALIALVAFCPLALGTVHLWSMAVAAALAAFAFGASALACLKSGEPFELPFPTSLFLAALGVVGFQLLPLPPALLGLIAPASAELFEFVLAPLEAWPSWRPLSLDPPATARELAKGLTCLAAFLAATQISRSRRARVRLVSALGFTGLTVALIGYAHELVGAEALFGRPLFRYAASPFLTTIGNPNHLSTLLSLGATALLARVLGERDRKAATLWAFAYLATGVAVLMTLSRGGIVSFLLAQALLFAGAKALLRSDGPRPLPSGLVAPAAVMTVIAVASYLAWDALAQEWATTDSLEKVRESKLGMWPAFLPLLRAHWLIGVGRGAFEPAFQRVQELAPQSTATHPESLIFQWTTELGAPMGLLLLGGCAFALAHTLSRRFHHVEPLACAAAVLAVGVHELADFGLEFAGVAVPASVAFAIALTNVAGRQRSSRREEGRRSRLRQRLALAATPPLALVMGVALAASSPTMAEGSERLASQLGRAPAEAIAAEAARLAERHPADYFPHLLAAQAFERERPLRVDRMLPFTARAMYLRPAHPTAHHLAARALLAAGRREQARLEYRLSIGYGNHAAIAEVARRFETAEDLLAAVPADVHAVGTLIDRLLQAKRMEIAQSVAERFLEESGDSAPILERLARIAAEQKDASRLEELATRTEKVAPESPAWLRMRVQSLLMTGREREGLTLLEQTAATRFPTEASLVIWLAELRLARNDTPGTREALRKLPPSFDPDVRIRSLLLEASAYEREGHGARAIGLLRTAVGMRPGHEGLKWQLASMLERTGRLDEATSVATGLLESKSYGELARQLQDRVAQKRKQLQDLHHLRALE